MEGYRGDPNQFLISKYILVDDLKNVWSVFKEYCQNVVFFPSLTSDFCSGYIDTNFHLTNIVCYEMQRDPNIKTLVGVRTIVNLIERNYTFNAYMRYMFSIKRNILDELFFNDGVCFIVWKPIERVNRQKAQNKSNNYEVVRI